jgi:TonB family protein
MQRYLIAFFISIVVVSGIGAQTPPPPPNPPADRPITKQISGGVLNGKALSLPKPPYPPAARAVGASGAVTVQVLIDENGDVVSANAVSGHPLLRAAAVEAARGAKFSPTELEGMPVKVSGVITYNFVGPLYPARLGSILSYAERSGAFGRYAQPESLANQMLADWVQEKEILNSLTFEETPVVEKVEPAKPPVEPAKSASKKESPQSADRFTAIRVTGVTAMQLSNFATRKLDAKSMTSLRNLMTLVEARASASESYAWSYELGRAIGVLLADIEDQSKLAANLAKIEALADRAPANIIRMSLEQLREFVNFAKAENVTDDVRREIAAKAEALANMRY